MPIKYEIVNVFTETPDGGNPLAVVFPDTAELRDDELLELTRQFGFSETAFVYPSDDPQHTAKIRIFTPNKELPFAGHPNVGTGYVLGRMGNIFGKNIGDEMIFEELSGLVEIKLTREADAVKEVNIKAPEALHIGAEIDKKSLAACLSLSLGFIADGHSPRFVSVGLPYVVVPLCMREALMEAKPNVEAYEDVLKELEPEDKRVSIFAYVWNGIGNTRLYARMFDRHGHEDPATGSAAGAAAAFFAHLDLRKGWEGFKRFVIEQGLYGNSVINVDVAKSDGKVGEVWISGPCVPISHGIIEPVRSADANTRYVLTKLET